MTRKKALVVEESRAVTGYGENRTRNVSRSEGGPILRGESDPVARRIREVVGEEPQRAFARRSGVSEGSLREYMSGKKSPGIKAATGIADAGGVLVDWLATGRLPKTRAAIQGAAQPVNQEALANILKGILQAAPGASADRIAALVAEFYVKMVAEGAIESGAAGTVKKPEAA